MMRCGHCGRTWDEAETPTPSGRCPFEYDHEYEEVVVVIEPHPLEVHNDIMRLAYPLDPVRGVSTVCN